ncbi:MAG: hypothetical protein P8Y07_03330 [Gemmatimonadales bacterium]
MKKSSSELNVVQKGAGQAKKPWRKMLNELKKLNVSKFVPTVIECLLEKKVKLSVN